MFECETMEDDKMEFVRKEFARYVEKDEHITQMTGLILERVNWIIDRIFELI